MNDLPNFTTLKPFSEKKDDSVYADVIAHCPERLSYSSRSTAAHEGTHVINAHIRNTYRAENGYPHVNGFYCLEGHGVVIDEPKILIRDIRPYVPKPLQNSRYELYFIDQSAWDDSPLYIFDEWVAYTNGAATNVDDVISDRYNGGRTDGVQGCLHFSIFAAALYKAVKELVPDYWTANTQFHLFTKWWMGIAARQYFTGKRFPVFDWDIFDKFYQELQNNPQCDELKQFICEHFPGTFFFEAI